MARSIPAAPKREQAHFRGPLLWPTAAEEYLALFPKRQDHNFKGRDMTYELRRSVLSRLQQRYPTKHLNEFTPEDIRDFLTMGHQDQRGRPTTLSDATIHSYTCQIRGFFKWAVVQGLGGRQGFPTANPADGLKFLGVAPRPKLRRKRLGNWLNGDRSKLDQLWQLLAADPTEMARRDQFLIRFLLYTGLRRTEASMLCWDGVDLAEATLVIVGKGRKLAEVALAPAAVTLISEWRNLAWKGLGHEPGPGDPVIPNMRLRPGTKIGFATPGDWVIDWASPVHPATIRARLQSWGKRIGVPNLAPHDMRRTMAGTLADLGVDLRDIQHQMRHDSVVTTEGYLTYNPSRRATAVAGLDFG